MIGEARAEAIRTMDNDKQFDRWMARYEREQQKKMSKSSGGRKKISKKKYLESRRKK